jgi:hypothetical protein
MNEEEDFPSPSATKISSGAIPPKKRRARPPVLRRGNLGRSQASRLAAAIASCARCRAAAWPHPSPGCNCSFIVHGRTRSGHPRDPSTQGDRQHRRRGSPGHAQ